MTLPPVLPHQQQRCEQRGQQHAYCGARTNAGNLTLVQAPPRVCAYPQQASQLCTTPRLSIAVTVLPPAALLHRQVQGRSKHA